MEFINFFKILVSQIYAIFYNFFQILWNCSSFDRDLELQDPMNTL